MNTKFSPWFHWRIPKATQSCHDGCSFRPHSSHNLWGSRIGNWRQGIEGNIQFVINCCCRWSRSLGCFARGRRKGICTWLYTRKARGWTGSSPSFRIFKAAFLARFIRTLILDPFCIFRRLFVSCWYTLICLSFWKKLSLC